MTTKQRISHEEKLWKHLVSALEWPWSLPAGIKPTILTTTPVSYVIDLNKFSTIRIFIFSWSRPDAKNTEVSRPTCERLDWVASAGLFYFRKSSSCLQSIKLETRRDWFSTGSSWCSATDNRWATKHSIFFCKKIFKKKYCRFTKKKLKKLSSASARAGHWMHSAWRGPG